MDQPPVSHNEWYSKHAAFLMANRILEVVESSEDAARETIEDVTIEELRELCRQACGLNAGDVSPQYVLVAEACVFGVAEEARGQTLDCLAEPMRQIRTELWPLLLRLVADHEARLQAYWRDPITDVDRELRRCDHKKAEDVRSTVDAFVQILRTIGALPTRSGGDNDDDAPLRPVRVYRADQRALASFEWVQGARPDLVPSEGGRVYTREMYDYICENGCPAYEGPEGKPMKPPSYHSWTRQIRRALQATGECSKASPRAGRSHGSSIVRADQL
jgi:hypothetical protein